MAGKSDVLEGGTMNESLLRVENLSKHYIVKKNSFSEKTVIDAAKDVSFEIFVGESLGLIGESGSGKSTTASLVLRLIEPSEGKVFLFGRDVTKLDERDMRIYRKDIQIVFQHSSAALDPKMTVEELLTEPLRIHRIVAEKEMEGEVGRLLGLVGLSLREKCKYPGQLSGGQSQRILIARAIATRPRLIVCDEPVSALDVSVQGQILNLLRDLKQELGLTYLFISHDLKVVRYMCERIAVMHRGEIVEMGLVDEVLEHPSHAHTRQLMDALL
jgi:peptide/nickel transport system ATP-binding protein/oligopeptide transport system ATP-binding protein